MKTNFDVKQNILKNTYFYKDDNNNDGKNISYMAYFKKDYKYPYKVICYNFYYDEKHNDIKFINYFDENNCFLKQELYKDNKIIKEVIKNEN